MNRKEKSARKNLSKEEAKSINLKSKRKRTLLRKAIEVSKMSNQLGIFILIKDDQSKKIYQYSSHRIEPDSFLFEGAIAALERAADGAFQTLRFTDKDYEKLMQQPSAKNDGQLEQIKQNILRATNEAHDQRG